MGRAPASGPSPGVVRRPGDPRLRPLLGRDLIGVGRPGSTGASWVQPPLAAVSLIVTLEGPVSTDGRRMADAWLGGLAGECATVTLGPSHASLDVKFAPLGAYALCGRSLRELAGGQIALEELFGPPGRRLEEQLHDAGGWPQRFDILERFLLGLAARARSPHPLAEAAWSRLEVTGGTIRVGALAAELGCSRRHLTALFTEQAGIGPKTAARLLRFARVRERIAAAPERWADIALDHGYCDQAHLNRDFRELARTTPTAFLSGVGAPRL